MNDIFIIYKNNKEYVYIDTIKYKNQMIYHFGSLEDEIFCIKKDMEYIPIQDNLKISIIKNKLGLIDSTKIYSLKEDSKEFANRTQDEFKFYLKLLKKKIIYRDITATVIEGEEKEKIIDEQKNNFKKIKEKLNVDIDLEKINKKISKVRLIKKEKLLGGRFSGYYNPVFNVVVLEKQNDINSDDKWYKHVRLHEYIHAMTGKKCLLYKKGLLRGLLEGETENLVESFFGSERSCFDVKKRESEYNSVTIERNDRIQYNFNKDITYRPLVSLVKQMEYTLGEKSHKSIINGNMEFESNFAKKYGMPLMIFMAYRTRMLMAGKKLNERFEDLQFFDEVQYFKETQDILMKKVFDKDFKSIKSIEDAKLYFQKLRSFETVRGRISTEYGNDFLYYEDKSFEDYYSEKYASTIEKLKRNGFTEDEIHANLENYKYEKQEFKTFRTKDEEQELAKEFVVMEIAKRIIKQKKKIVDYNKYDFEYLKTASDSYYFFCINNETSGKMGFSIQNSYEKEVAKKNLTNILKNCKDQTNYTDFYEVIKNGEYKLEKIEFQEGEFEERIKQEFIRTNEELEYKMFNTIMYGKHNEETKQQVINMKQDSKFIEQVLNPEKDERKEEINHSELYEEMLEMAEKTGILSEEPKVYAWAGPCPGPSPVVTTGAESEKNKKGKIAEKVAKLKGLITLKKSQDNEIEQLEDNIKKKGKTIDGQ